MRRAIFAQFLDTGFDVDDRDAKRIHAAAREAGLQRIDRVVISHYHWDHVGGLAAPANTGEARPPATCSGSAC